MITKSLYIAAILGIATFGTLEVNASESLKNCSDESSIVTISDNITPSNEKTISDTILKAPNTKATIKVISVEHESNSGEAFTLQNQYTCGSCNAKFDNIIESDSIDKVFQPLQNISQDLNNVIDVLENPSEYTIPEFYNSVMKFYSIQFPLLSQPITELIKKDNITKNNLLSALSNSNEENNRVVEMWNNYDVKEYYSSAKEIFLKYCAPRLAKKFNEFYNTLKYDNISSFRECSDKFLKLVENNLLILLNIANKLNKNDAKILRGDHDDSIYIKLFNNIDKINKALKKYYNYDEIEKLIKLRNNQEIIIKGENNRVIKIKLNEQLALLNNVMEKFRNEHNNFVKTLIGTQCKMCGAKFINK